MCSLMIPIAEARGRWWSTVMKLALASSVSAFIVGHSEALQFWDRVVMIPAHTGEDHLYLDLLGLPFRCLDAARRRPRAYTETPAADPFDA